LTGTFGNDGLVVESPSTRWRRTGLHWRVFEGAGLEYQGLDGKIEAVRLEAVDARNLRVIAINTAGAHVGPYLLGSKAVWYCLAGKFVNETDSPLAGEGNVGDIHERTTLATDASGNLVFETITSIQRRSVFLLGGKVGGPEVTRRAFVFDRLSRSVTCNCKTPAGTTRSNADTEPGSVHRMAPFIVLTQRRFDQETSRIDLRTP